MFRYGFRYGGSKHSRSLPERWATFLAEDDNVASALAYLMGTYAQRVRDEYVGPALGYLPRGELLRIILERTEDVCAAAGSMAPPLASGLAAALRKSL